jgi:hypothetical protein
MTMQDSDMALIYDVVNNGNMTWVIIASPLPK